jgi:hypothetical protein
MSGETEQQVSGWTVDTWAQHSSELRQADKELTHERDRRYAEVNIEKEKALKIKEEADKAALGLAREIQTYKDEKANELRSQIERERGNYATRGDLVSAVEKIEAQMKPLGEYVQAQSGPRAITGATIVAVLGAVAIVVGLFIALVPH